MMIQAFMRSGFVVAAIGLSLMLGCTGRKVTTAVEDQSILAARTPSDRAPLSATPGPSPSDRAPAAATPGPSPTEMPGALIQPDRPVRPPVVEERVEAVHPPSPGASAGPPPVPTAEPPSATPALADAYFDFDQYTIRDDAQQALEQDARILKANPGRELLIEGHCDERGTMAYNLVLGERRARAVQRYLQELGVPASAIQIVSYGKERPVCREHSESCWQSNRRAHVTVR